MKILVIGLGSMGKRRIRNLIANGEHNIYGFDLREDRSKEVEEEYQIKVFRDFQTANSEQDFNAFIISVPPDRHMEFASYAIDNNIHCFIEASVVDDGMKELILKSIEKPEIKICPSCTLRYHPAIKLIKKLVDYGSIGKVSHFSYHSGQYLPDWHPWEKITDFYVSNRNTGGCREIVPFELTWLNWLFGDIDRIVGYKSKTINLDADIDDVYVSSIKYKNGILGTLLVDIVSRYAIRKLIINGDNGQIQWDWNNNKVDVYDSFEKRWITYRDPQGHSAEGYNKNIVEEMYIAEMKDFIDSIKYQKPFPNTLEEDYQILQYLYQLEDESK